MQIKKSAVFFIATSIFFILSFLLINQYRSKIYNLVVMLKDLSFSQREEFIEIEKKIREVKIGMLKEDVQLIIGKPESISFFMDRGREREVWVFKHPKVASEPARCIFDKTTSKVVEVVSGEDYHLREEQKESDSKKRNGSSNYN